jgi:hypothetical protein
MLNSSVISVSQTDLNCDDIITYLYKTKIKCNVTPNKSIIKTSRGFKIENGCRIILNPISRQDLEYKIWKPLSQQHNLKCAHLNIPGEFSDCIHNFFRHKQCK